jgi:hypothetical protein
MAVDRSLRKLIICSNKDVVSAYKSIVAHWLQFKTIEETLCHPFFLTPKKDFRPHDKIWFGMGPVGRNTLQLYTKCLAEGVDSLKGRKIMNKSGRGTGITRLNKALVPIAKAMETTSHRMMDTFEKYNCEKKIISERATQRVLSGDLKDL